MDQNQNETPAAGEPDVGSTALEKLSKAGVDLDQLQALKEKLSRIRASGEATHSGSEKPADVDASEDERLGGRVQLLSGRDVDWSEYDLDFNVRHLYPKAQQRHTPEGVRWVASVVTFHSTTREFNKHGVLVNAPGSVDKAITEPLNLGEYLGDMCNGPDQWRIAAVMPAGAACGLLLEREYPVILPEPIRLKKEEEVEAPSDPELKAVEDAALDFMAEQNGLDIEPVLEDYTPEPAPVGLRAIERGSAEDEAIRESLEDGAIAPAAPRRLTGRALDLNREHTLPAPQGKGLQPEPVENPIIEAPVPAAGYSAAADLLRALNDPDYRKNLPQE